MRYNNLIILILITQCFYGIAENHNLLDVDFIKSLTDDYKETTKPKNNAEYIDRLEFFKKNYEAKKPSKMVYNKKPLIPKIMHQIWIGPNPMPPLYKNYLNECKKLHPDWEFKIWTDQDIKELNLDNQFLDTARSYVLKSDLLRYEILYKFGGVYRDTDVKCYKPLDDLNHKYEFFSVVEPLRIGKKVIMNNGIIGATAGHKIMGKTLELIQKNLEKSLDYFDNSLKLKSIHGFAVHNTMHPLAYAFCNNVSLDDKNIAFPPTYFLPLLFFQNNNIANVIRKNIVKNKDYPYNMKFESLKPETLMWHNLDKNEVVKVNFDIGNGLDDYTRKRLLNALSKQEQKIYLLFKNLYAIDAGWNKVSKIPQVINFIVFNAKEREELNKHMANWKMLNGDFEIKIWDQNSIEAEFADVSKLPQTQNVRLYIALKIIERFGGTYAQFDAQPITPIFELNNKYNFYAGLKPVNKSTKHLVLSARMFGADKNNNIIVKTLAQIDPKNVDSINKVNFIWTRQTYQWMYLNGNNIILPAIYFDPIDKLEDQYLYLIPDYIVRFVQNIPKSLSEFSGYSILK